MSYNLSPVVILLPALLQISSLEALGATISVPLNQPTIQAAIDIAQNGDVIVVSPGTYFENIDFLGKAITVNSEGSARATIIDGGAKGSVVTFAAGEDPASILSGFTIRNGRSGFDTPGFGDGGGIRIDNASPTIRNNIIMSNHACTGAGISISFGSPVIQGNRIEGNAQEGCSGGTGGGGINVRGAGAARIRGNLIANNFMGSADGGGIALFAAGAPTIRGNVIHGNTATGISPCAQGGGISMVNQSDAVIVQNLITGNSAGCGGGVHWLVPSGARGPLLVNNTIADNLGASGSGIFTDGFDAGSQLINNLIVASAGEAALFCGDFNDNNPPILRFNDVFSAGGSAYAGTCPDLTGIDGNISADPLFVSASAGNYHIRQHSPAVDAGDNGAPKLRAFDFDGNQRIQDGDRNGLAVIDMGIDEFTPRGATSDRPQSVFGSDPSLSDDVGDSLAPVPNPQPSFRPLINETRSDNRVTVFTYDAAGHLITSTDPSGLQTDARRGRSGS